MTVSDLEPGPVPVLVAPTTNPRGENAVLLQFPDGWMVTSPANARTIAALLLDVADEVEGVAHP